MFDLGVQELVVICVVALVVFGPKRLPELGKAIGKTVGQIRSAISDVRNEVEREIHVAESGLDLEEMPAWKKKDAGQTAGTQGDKPVEEESEGEKPAVGESEGKPEKKEEGG